MLKKIILFVIFLFIPLVSNADFNTWTEVTTSNLKFSKIPQIWQVTPIYKVYEDYYINPFAASIIKTITDTNTTTDYRFSPPKITTTTTNIHFTINWISSNNTALLPNIATTNYIYQWWTTEFNDLKWNIVKTKIVYLEPSYTLNSYWNKKPKQKVLVRKYYKVTFSYDTTLPTCWNVKLYNDNLLQSPYNTANLQWNVWINKPIYYTLQCSDIETGCKQVNSSLTIKKANGNIYSVPRKIWYLSSPVANFMNNVDLNNSTCIWNLPPGISYFLADYKTPSIDFAFWQYGSIPNLENSWINNYFDSIHVGNRKYFKDINWKKYNWVQIFWKNFYSLNNKLSNLAGNRKITFSIIDKYLGKSASWVSGIKKYLINIKDKNNNIVYTGSKIYPVYNQTWLKKISDKKLVTIDIPWILKTWNYTIFVTAKDFAWNKTKITAYFDIYPNNNLKPTISLSPSTTHWTKYANNFDKYIYTLNLKDKFDNPIYNKNIININQDCNGITWCKTIKVDMVNSSLWDALIENWYLLNKTDISWNINFWLKSYTPWDFTPRFKIKLKKWDNKYVDIGSQNFYTPIIPDNKFKQPIIWDLKVSNDSWATWTAKPELWTTQKYRINLQNKWSLWVYNLSIISNWKLDIIHGFKDKTPWHKLQNLLISLSNTFSNFTNYIQFYFTTRINATSNVLIAPVVSSTGLVISYTLGTKPVKYYLKDFSITWNNLANLWVKVIWTLQWSWKAVITWQKSNFSDISKSTTRGWLKKKIYTLIRWMNSGDIINWIKYVKWSDVTLSWSQAYSTLVVEDWNVIIKGDITKTLWIFSLNNNLWNKWLWNVYVTPNVTKIDAIIYADEWFISSDINWNPYIKDNNARTAALQNQLILTWSLFTRNTIGWAVLWQLWEYILPWWSRTKDFNEAMKYDLNYVRRWNKWCLDQKDNKIWILTPGWDWICDIYSDYFIIKYNPAVQTNPPIGF